MRDTGHSGMHRYGDCMWGTPDAVDLASEDIYRLRTLLDVAHSRNTMLAGLVREACAYLRDVPGYRLTVADILMRSRQASEDP